MSETAHPSADVLDALTTRELLEIMHREDLRAVESVQAALLAIGEAVEQISARLRSGGRLHYFGAGTSGRLATLDAAECPATFGVPPDLVQAHAAGDGVAEDDHGQGADDSRRAGLGPRDVAVGLNMISTGVFTRLGHTYRGRMVDVVAANEKLRGRAARMVRELTGCSDDRVDAALHDAGGSAKIAIMMLRTGIDAAGAGARLSAAHGDLAVALGEKGGA